MGLLLFFFQNCNKTLWGFPLLLSNSLELLANLKQCSPVLGLLRIGLRDANLTQIPSDFLSGDLECSGEHIHRARIIFNRCQLKDLRSHEIFFFFPESDSDHEIALISAPKS